jgi:hypothetical protein
MGNKNAHMQKKVSEFMKDAKKKMGDWWGNLWYWWACFESKH